MRSRRDHALSFALRPLRVADPALCQLHSPSLARCVLSSLAASDLMLAVGCALLLTSLFLAWAVARLPTPIALALSSVGLATASLATLVARLGSRAAAEVRARDNEHD